MWVVGAHGVGVRVGERKFRRLRWPKKSLRKIFLDCTVKTVKDDYSKYLQSTSYAKLEGKKINYFLAVCLIVLHTTCRYNCILPQWTRGCYRSKEAAFHKQHKSMSRPPAAKIFTALDLARRIPEYSRKTLLISALSAEKHTHFLSQLDVFIGVNYKAGGEVQGKMDHGNCVYAFKKNSFLSPYLI